MARQVQDTGKTTSTKKHDTDEIVNRKVYTITEQVMIRKEINYELLLKRKTELEAEIAEIDDILSKIPADQ